MKVSGIGFSGNYRINLTLTNECMDILKSGFAIATKTGDTYNASTHNGDLYLTTNNRQFSADDFLFMKKALASASAIFNIKYPDKAPPNPFSDTGSVSTKIEKAFRIDATNRGLIV